MSVIFDNPAGGFALLGVPLLIGIHLLQARSRRTPVATLFLLDRLAPESRGGLKLQKLRRSLPLVLRLLAVLALTWLLVQPRFIRPDSSQRIAVVLDSSLSMDASLKRLREALPARLARLTAFAARTEWVVTESDTRLPTVYHGDDFAALSAALRRWRPSLGDHDVAPALTLASTTVRGAGLTVLVTDKPGSGKVGAATLAYGEFVENCGFIGATVEPGEHGPVWSALVRNHGRRPRTLEWSLEADGAPVSKRPLTLAPGETASISGEFPEGVTRLRATLPADDFTVDDTLPLIRPAPRRIRVFNGLDGADAAVVDRVLAGIPAVVRVSDAAACDLRYARADAPAAAPGVPAVLFAPVATRREPGKGAVLPEAHAFTEDAAWQGLTVAAVGGGVNTDTDLPIVWRGATPLVAVRAMNGASPSLVVDFSTVNSNAAKVPAFVVLLRRHLESVRDRLAVPYALNTDTHRLLAPPPALAGGRLTRRVGESEPVSLDAAQAAVLRAPDRPAFFEVAEAGRPWVTGAAQFGDAREADFSACASADTLESRERTLAHASSAPDPFRTVWFVLLGLLLIAAWWVQRVAADSPRAA